MSESKEAPVPEVTSPHSPSLSAPFSQSSVPFAHQIDIIECVQREWEECNESTKSAFSIHVGVVE